MEVSRDRWGHAATALIAETRRDGASQYLPRANHPTIDPSNSNLKMITAATLIGSASAEQHGSTEP
jgi:hypothetical protein